MRIYGNRLTYDEPRPSSLTELQWLAAPAWTLAQICVLANMQRMWAVRETEKGGYVVSGSAIQDDSGVICRMNALWTLF